MTITTPAPQRSRLPKISFWLFVLGLLNLAAIPVLWQFYTLNAGWSKFNDDMTILVGGVGIASVLGVISLITGLIVVRRHKRVLWWVLPLIITAGTIVGGLLVDPFRHQFTDHWGVAESETVTAILFAQVSIPLLLAWVWWVFKSTPPQPGSDTQHRQ